MNTACALEELIGAIFDILRKDKSIRNDRAAFRQACSALDAIGDTHFALNEFVGWDAPSGTGIKYILAYGVLQAIFLQQDAIKHLALSLGLPFQLPEALREIRELRNEAIGHPTHKTIDKNKEIKSFHHIARVSLSKNGFQLLSTYSDRDSFDIKDVDFNNIIHIQAVFACRLLSQILERLKTEEKNTMNPLG